MHSFFRARRKFSAFRLHLFPMFTGGDHAADTGRRGQDDGLISIDLQFRLNF
jgi:hypothetical protein